MNTRSVLRSPGVALTLAVIVFLAWAAFMILDIERTRARLRSDIAKVAEQQAQTEMLHTRAERTLAEAEAMQAETRKAQAEAERILDAARRRMP
jgi:F0F1-type ATP synthase membrane subunit b/b'